MKEIEIQSNKTISEIEARFDTAVQPPRNRFFFSFLSGTNTDEYYGKFNKKRFWIGCSLQNQIKSCTFKVIEGKIVKRDDEISIKLRYKLPFMLKLVVACIISLNFLILLFDIIVVEHVISVLLISLVALFYFANYIIILLVFSLLDSISHSKERIEKLIQYVSKYII